MPRILILGAGGMLGSAFAQASAGTDATTAGRARIDAEGVEAILRGAAPQLVINCAAHTDVEGAERDGGEAWKANAVMPGELASGCRAIGATLVHFSSTGVYGAWKDTRYVEDDRPEPTTAHHHSKRAGEVAIAESGCDHLIVRTGWLFGGAPGAAKNFVWNRLVEASGKQQMISDPFQHGCPTYVVDVVRQVTAAVESGVRGVVNVVAEGAASRFSYVERIVNAAGLPCSVQPADAPFKRLAPVSPNETAANDRLHALGLAVMPRWEEAVDRYVAELISSPAWAARGSR